MQSCIEEISSAHVFSSRHSCFSFAVSCGGYGRYIPVAVPGGLTSFEITFKSRYLLAYAKRKCGEEFLRQPWDARLHGDQLLYQSLVLVF